MQSDHPAERLLAANRAPRCQHSKWNGEPCGSPALKEKPFCFFHDNQHLEETGFRNHFLEDAANLQLAVMQVIRALRDRTFDTKTCALMLYALQIASSNLKRLQQEGRLDDAVKDASFAELVLQRFDLLDEVSDLPAEPKPPGVSADSPPAEAAS